MVTNLFANLAVNDLSKSIEFFTNLGFKFNLQFTDETATCLILGDNIFAMLLTKDKMKKFTPKELVDATKSTEVLLAISVESREEVDLLVQKAIDNGGNEFKQAEDLGFMYTRRFEDLDGHIWEVFYMDPNYVQDNQ